MQTGSSRRRQSGSFLLEALISVAIFAFGLLALVGLANKSLNQVVQTKARNDASYLASELVGQMWISAATPAAFDTTPAFTTWETRVQNSLPGGASAVAVNGTQVSITITWADSKNESTRHSYVTSTQIAK